MLDNSKTKQGRGGEALLSKGYKITTKRGGGGGEGGGGGWGGGGDKFLLVFWIQTWSKSDLSYLGQKFYCFLVCQLSQTATGFSVLWNNILM